MRRVVTTIALAAAAVAAPATQAADARYGIVGEKAPAWGVETWFGLPDGAARLELADLEGKVIYLYCFQSWCPGCHSHGFPTLREVREHFLDAGADDVAFVAVQTVFEGHRTNTATKAKSTVAGFELDIPTGHDPGAGGRRPSLMRGYRTGGTPWTILIDKRGVVRFNGFRIRPDKAIAAIEKLRAEPDQAPARP